jgi:hypothetical protein
VAIAISSITSGTDTGASATVSVTTSESPVTTKVGDLVVVVYANDFYALSNMGTPSATGTPDDERHRGGNRRRRQQRSPHQGVVVRRQHGGRADGLRHRVGCARRREVDHRVCPDRGGHDTPVDAAAGNTSTTTITTSQVAPAVSPTTTNAFLICQITAGGGAAAASYTTPSPLTEQFEIHAGSHLRCRRDEPAQRVGFDGHVHLHGGEQHGVLVVFDRHQDGDGGDRHLPAAARAVP